MPVQKHNGVRPAALFSNRPVAVETLEDRRLLSGSPGDRGGPGGPGGGFAGPTAGATILFSQAPAAVQTGLTTLAAAGSFAAPTASQSVILGNSNGVESYTVVETGTGTTTRLTVDVTGAAVAAPVRSSTTFGAITNTAVTAEVNAIATALSLTAPTSTTAVNVSTASGGAVTYSVNLTSTSTTNAGRKDGITVSVDSAGNPVGDATLPLSVFSAAVRTGLTSRAPIGATALTSTSPVQVRTLNGVTTYSATYTATGTRTTVTVNAAGQLTNLPSASNVTFSAVPAAAAAALQTLATADGVAGTIAATQSVTAYDEANGITVYSVRLVATGTNSSGTTYTYPITLSVDQAGNPTVPPDFGGGGFLPGGGPGTFGGGGFGGGGPGGGGPGKGR